MSVDKCPVAAGQVSGTRRRPVAARLPPGGHGSNVEMMRRTQAATLVAALTLSLACTAPGRDETHFPASETDLLFERITLLESELPDLLTRTAVPGLAAAVVLDGEIFWARGFGSRRADAPNGHEVDEASIFGAASLTKPVVSYAVMKLVDEGRLELDWPLVEYLAYEDLADDERARAITTRMVLSHSTGLPNWRPDRWTDNPGRLATQFEPGSRFQYSGEGMIYLQRVVEEITGQPLDELLKAAVFEPLGMTRSNLLWEERFEENYAVPHREDLTPREDRRPDEALAAGTLQTTATDYARFLIAVLDGTGLAEGTLEEILTPQVEVGEGVWWGLGWGLEEGEVGKAIWQWGHDPGSRAFAIAVPDRRLGMVFFANSDNGMLLLRRIVDGTLGGTEHPALDHLDYESFDSPRRQVRIEIERSILEEGIPNARARYAELRKEYGEQGFGETMLNRLAYELLGSDKVAEAIALFELNVEAYPEAFNTYDSLGEAYMIHGEAELAIANYERSLELNPDNGNAVEMLKKLREGAGV